MFPSLGVITYTIPEWPDYWPSTAASFCSNGSSICLICIKSRWQGGIMSSRLLSGLGFDPKIFRIWVVDAKDNIQDMEVGRILGRSRSRPKGGTPSVDFDGFSWGWDWQRWEVGYQILQWWNFPHESEAAHLKRKPPVIASIFQRVIAEFLT